MTMKYYMLDMTHADYATDFAVFEAVFNALLPANNLSVVESDDGKLALVKAPFVKDRQSVIAIYDSPPFDVLATDAWSSTRRGVE